MASRTEPTEDHNRSKWRSFLPVFVVSVGLAAVIVYTVARPAPEPPRGSDRVEFSLPLLSGDGTLTSSDLTGKVVVINFWASWCVPCRDEMPEFEQVWQVHKDRVAFVGVDLQDKPEDAREFAREVDVTYPLVVDEGGRFARRLGVPGLPATFFLDIEGRLVEQVLGRMTGDQLEQILADLMEEA